MAEQENFEQKWRRRDSAGSPEEIRLVKEQWIPDTEEIIRDVSDGVQRSIFEKELSQIKADFAGIENANFGDEDALKGVYDRAEGLYGEIRLYLKENEKSEV